MKWPETKLIHTVHTVRLPFANKTRSMKFKFSKIVLRCVLVVITTLVAMMVPFFNAILGLLGALSFWPLTVFFPVIIHITQMKIQKGTRKWLMLHGLSMMCLLVSVFACIGSIADIVTSLKHTALFQVPY